ncbi:MAG: type III pantothenate kinase [Cyclobacteriaceae bacterium]|nr:type III pantothenate kinase [Cyclobacteriaceae bacterium]
MKAVVDRGNTWYKIGWFDKDRMVDKKTASGFSEVICEIMQSDCTSVLFASVSETMENELKNLRKDIKVWTLSTDMPLPVVIDYKTPTTLGKDRIAAAAGAAALYKDSNVLIIDAGTCITYDLLEEGKVYRGGAIAPGLNMRLKAMHHFTHSLPEVELAEEVTIPAKSTATCLQAGATVGLCFEIEGMIQHYTALYPDLITLMCGGDTFFFESKIKASIFAIPDLVLIGLNSILNYNEL